MLNLRYRVNRIFNRSRDIFFLPWFDPYWVRRLRGNVLCLVYHRVGDAIDHPFLSWGGSPVIAPEDLDWELSFLRDVGARFLTFADLRQGSFPDPGEFGVIVTFDDGFRDVYDKGLEVLDRQGIKAVIFQSTAMIQGTGLIWEHELFWLSYHPEYRGLLLGLTAGWPHADPTQFEASNLINWLRGNYEIEQIQVLLEQTRNDLGLVDFMAQLASTLYPRDEDIRNAIIRGHEIGSHGHHHYPRRSLSEEMFEQELHISAGIIESILNQRSNSFAYPYSEFLPGDTAICARYFDQVATVEGKLISKGYNPLHMPRCTWPGPQPNHLRRRRWLLTGSV